MKITKYLFLFIIISLFFSGIFACHIYTAEAANLIYDTSDFCLDEKEVLINQNRTQNDQELTFDFNSIILEKLSNLIKEIDTSTPFLGDSNNFQIDQLLTIAKIE